jgi:hypothetical protein
VLQCGEQHQHPGQAGPLRPQARGKGCCPRWHFVLEDFAGSCPRLSMVDVLGDDGGLALAVGVEGNLRRAGRSSALALLRSVMDSKGRGLDAVAESYLGLTQGLLGITESHQHRVVVVVASGGGGVA